MTFATPAPVPIRHRITAGCAARLLGYVPSESVVLIPVRDARPTGALRFSLTAIDPLHAARAFIGALGRFGRADSAAVVVFSSRPRRPETEALLEALRRRASGAGLGELDVLTADRPALLAGTEQEDRGLLPTIPREERLAVAAEVDALLDRHPHAQLPERLRASADAAFRRAVSGRADRPRAAVTAALVVCAQRDHWAQEALSTASAGSGGDLTTAIALISGAAVCAPEPERAAVLVLLAALHDLAGRRDLASAVARRAVRTDPHDLAARRLVAALESAEGTDASSSMLLAS